MSHRTLLALVKAWSNPPIGDRYPKEPPNYLGFRWNGKLQQIRHVEGYEVFTDPHEHIPGWLGGSRA